MRSLRRTLAIIILLSCLPAGAESVRSLYNKAVKAEARQDYEAAYEYYKAAYDKKPDDLKYRVPFERMRFLASASLVRRAQKLREQGNLQEALQIFLKASAVDPSNDLALQEVRRTQQAIQKQQPPGDNKPAAPPPEEDTLRRRLEQADSPVDLGPLSGVPLHALKVTADSKQIYETIGRVAGLNVLFDPDYTARRLSVDLQEVSIQQALDIVALESRTFWRPVTPNTIFVAADSQAKRRELEQSVIKTFYLGNVATPTDLQDVVNAIRTILEVQRIQQIPSQNAIIVRGTPDQLALAQKMIDDIDKSKPEIIVDVVVAQVRRDKVRQMGILPPQNASAALQGSNTASTGTGGTTTTTTGSGLNFNNLQHLNSTNYAVTIDPVHAQLLFNDNNTRIMQQPQIRAGDGIKATLKIGDRIPVATGSFGTPLGIGTGVGALGVNTQFQYLDVGVNIDITPHVHPDHEISLKVSLEISSQTGTASIGGINQPIISRRFAEQEIRLRDGEMNLLGGILEDQVTVNSSGTPILSQIPILKYLFSSNDKERHTNEVVFLLIPHIVRSQDLSPMNIKALDVGTGASGVELHRRTPKTEGKPQSAVPTGQPQQGRPGQQALPSQSVTPSQPAETQPSQQQPAQIPAQTQMPAQGPAGTNTPGGPTGPVSLRLDPGTVAPTQGTPFNLNVVLAGGQDVFSVPLQITYDPRILQFVSVSNGDFLTRDGQPVALAHRDDAVSGTLQISAQRPPGSAGVNGDGVVFNLMFMAKTKGASSVVISNPGARNSQNQALQAQGSKAAITIN